MDIKVGMVMLTAKVLNVQEMTVIGLSLFYNSGRYFEPVLLRDDLEEEYDKYLHGTVSQAVEDFCIDYLSGRIPPNLLMNALEIQYNKKKTQRIKVRKGKE